MKELGFVGKIVAGLNFPWKRGAYKGLSQIKAFCYEQSDKLSHIYNGNRTEWSPIQSIIIRVSDDHVTGSGVRFV